MLESKSVAAVVAVKGLDVAKKFYEGTLGLSTSGDMPGGALYKCAGGSSIFVYESDQAGTNKATAAAWGVGDNIEKVVEGLKAKGVSFEHYDNIPNAKVEGDVHVMGDLKAAWFKDPDGNILNIVNKM